jgi:hypothetical protein
MKRENATSVGFTGNGLKRPKQYPKPFWEVHDEEVARRSCLSPLTLQPKVLSGGRVSPAEARFLSGEASVGSSNKWSGSGLLYKYGIPVPQLSGRVSSWTIYYVLILLAKAEKKMRGQKPRSLTCFWYVQLGMSGSVAKPLVCPAYPGCSSEPLLKSLKSKQSSTPALSSGPALR